jgi:formate hydrogenlyase transcriptional activator
VRELENFIERAVILSRAGDLEIPLGELKPRAQPVGAFIAASLSPSSPDAITTLEAAERDHIVRVLEQTGWVIGGPTGAAVRLGMKRTTLQSRMKKLGIARLN